MGKNSSSLPLSTALFTSFLCALFGANAVAIKISLTGFGAFTAMGVRFATAAFVIFLWGTLTGKPLALTKKQFLTLCPLALIFFVQLSLFYLGQGKTTATHGTLIANIVPFVVMVLAHYFIPDELIVKGKIYGLLLGFSGVLLLVYESLEMTKDALHGDLLILLAVFVWGVNAIYTKRIIEGFHPLQITFYPMICSLPLFFSAAFCFDEQMIIGITKPVIFAFLYQSLITASFGMVAWNFLIRKYGATQLHSFIFLMPVSGVILGVLLLGEPMTVTLFFSIMLVVGGLLIVNRK